MPDPILWHPAALSRDLPAATVMPTACGDVEVALWRSAGGRVSAWYDRCPHRGMRLSHGFVRGEMLSCIYHGWRFDTEAVCRKIPAHPDLTPPETITVPRFRAAERHGVIWIAPRSDAAGQGQEAGQGQGRGQGRGTLDDGDPAPDALPPLPGDLGPLRSLQVARDGAAVADALGGWHARVAGGVHVLVQALPGGHAALHSLIDPEGDAIAASRRLEALRRDLESEAAA
ncbi:Rieske (2Fe-2S) protein [Mesobaculum littorinae]|uniref:Rieske (2Fe-2S) protein n=1 Tax=Mesobaculum littorinae TaxID=2486419 RepID=A0A438AJR2_9RHOB|nr:Rieske (2Fe-2S) protein [Mesobaculum littorinae]RVV98922.1 Rieske (2Fe-2S) protein [Mesobaculum littorinae]